MTHQEHAPYEVIFEPVTEQGVVIGPGEPAYREVMCGCTEEFRYRWEDHFRLAKREALNEWEDLIR